MRRLAISLNWQAPRLSYIRFRLPCLLVHARGTLSTSHPASHTGSITVAVPMPLPRTERHQCGSLAAAVEFVKHRAPVHRAGCAERMAKCNRAAIDLDLFGFDLERLNIARTTEANASLSSKRSLSDFFMPQRSNSLLVISTGPVSIIETDIGESPYFCTGLEPYFAPTFLLPSSTAAAPSRIPDELPA